MAIFLCETNKHLQAFRICMTWLYSGELQSKRELVVFELVVLELAVPRVLMWSLDEDEDRVDDDEDIDDVSVDVHVVVDADDDVDDELGIAHDDDGVVDDLLDMRAAAMAAPMLAHFSLSLNLSESKLLMICEADVNDAFDGKFSWESAPWQVALFDVGTGADTKPVDGVEHIAFNSFKIPSRIRISRSILLFNSSFLNK